MNPRIELARDRSTFWREFRNNFQTTGAVLPSSRSLARAITRMANSAPRPARILEAGPGTGAFTDSLVSMLGPGDELVLAEISESFVEVLRRRLDTDPNWNAKRDQVRIHHGPVEQLEESARFHAVVCGLPFNNFEPEVVDQLFRGFLDRLEPGGAFSFFEYLWIRAIKAPIVGSKERERLRQVASVIDHYLQEHRIASDRVFRNVPPAVAHHLCAA